MDIWSCDLKLQPDSEENHYLLHISFGMWVFQSIRTGTFRHLGRMHPRIWATRRALCPQDILRTEICHARPHLLWFTLMVSSMQVNLDDFLSSDLRGRGLCQETEMLENNIVIDALGPNPISKRRHIHDMDTFNGTTKPAVIGPACIMQGMLDNLYFFCLSGSKQ